MTACNLNVQLASSPKSSPSLIPSTTSIDAFFLKMAISESQKCTPSTTAYSVGCVIVRSESHNPFCSDIRTVHRVLSTGHSREIEGNTHAEQCAMIKWEKGSIKSTVYIWQGQDEMAEGKDIVTMYTTMEPCSTRLSGNTSCVDRILDFNRRVSTTTSTTTSETLLHTIQRVVIGVREPPNFVAHCVGVKRLEEEGMEVVFERELEEACLQVNRHIVG
jgi:pyrimidine deaminase RibD-like protein